MAARRRPVASPAGSSAALHCGPGILAALLGMLSAQATLWCVDGVAPASPGVTLADQGGDFLLANGQLEARIDKRSGDLLSLRFHDLELLGSGAGQGHGYWSHTPAASPHIVAAVTIDPGANGGERGEVSIKGYAQGHALGGGPGGSVVADIEIRYALARGETAIATYSVFTHIPDYPATAIGEARFAAKLNARIFDFLTVDEHRRKVMAKPEDWEKGTQLNLKEARRLTTGIYAGQVEHKYDYSAIQFAIPAFGWSSSEHHLGLWFINPSIEYLSGGATKVELTGHLDGGSGAAPTLLNYWRGSHYGGSFCTIAQGESWTRVVGPFLIYCNAAAGGEPALWQDALATAAAAAAAWPYAWVAGVDYPGREQRGAVSGQLALDDPQATAGMSNLLVGVAAPDYPARDDAGGPVTVDWQRDAKFYQFWVHGGEQGSFTIAKVRPGTYTLHAIADGVLGEFAVNDVVVQAGRTLDLGKLQWRPLRRGRQLWEIGIPNRSAEEFRHGDHFWQWGLYNDYAREFPDDVHFAIGVSDWRKDWNYVQPPRIAGDKVTPTSWTITFPLTEAPLGTATLRLAIAGSRAPHGVEVAVNGQAVGGTGPLPDTGVMHRDGIRGYWVEREVSFPAKELKAGGNALTLHVPASNWVNGVLYDYLRLEVDGAAKP
jgi:rhamnogalacturonan endolyase